MVGSISTIGVGSGLDLQGIMDQLREVDEKALLEPKQTRVTAYAAQLEEFSVVKNKLFTMKSAALNLSLSSTFLSRSVSSSDEDVLTATVSDGSSTQSATVDVTSIASKSSWISSNGASSTGAIVYVPTSAESTTGVADKSTASVSTGVGNQLNITFGGSESITVDVPDGTVLDDGTATSLVGRINAASASVTASSFEQDGAWYLRVETATPGGIGEANRVTISSNGTDLAMAAPDRTFAYTMDGETISVAVAADTTLTGLLSLINDDADNPGVTASVIDDGQSSPYRLALKANATGEDNRIDISTHLADLVLAEQNGAGGSSLNARISVDGIAYQRQTNSFSDVMSGVTLTLKDAGSASVTVAANTDTLKTLVIDLVAAYNDLVQEIKTNIAYSEDTGEFGVLAGTTIRDLPLSLQSLMTREVGAGTGGNITTMFDLGMSFERDGTISIDSTVLASKLESNPTEVQDFFLGNDDEGIVGFADLVNEQLRTLTSSTGQVEAEKNGAQSRMDALELLITSETDRLNKKYELLSKQFVQLDRYMNQMTSISNYLNSQFNSLSSTSQSGSK